MSGPGLAADRGQIERFVSALFVHAEPGTFISLRAFYQRAGGRPPLLIEPVEINGDFGNVVDAAANAAERAANAAEPTVFAPPVAVFSNNKQANMAALAGGLTIAVELDAGDTHDALARLQYLIGPTTMAIAS